MVVWEALDALSHQLELCRIDATTSVVVVLDDHTSRYRDLIRAAVARTGADALEVQQVHRDGGIRSGKPRLLAAILAEADVVITCVEHPGEVVRAALAETPGQVLHLRSVDLAPQDYPPHVNLGHRVQILVNHVEAATQLHVSDRYGTGLSIGLAGGAVSYDDGLPADHAEPVHFPAGWVAVIPGQAFVRGDIVLMPGDAITSTRFITSPLRLQVRDGHLTAIEGEHADADVVRAVLEYSGQPSTYRLSQVSVGLNPIKAVRTLFDPRLLDPQLARLAAGVVTVSFGVNDPGRHGITFALARRTVRLDAVPLVTDGVLDGDFAPDVYEL